MFNVQFSLSLLNFHFSVLTFTFNFQFSLSFFQFSHFIFTFCSQEKRLLSFSFKEEFPVVQRARYFYKTIYKHSNQSKYHQNSQYNHDHHYKRYLARYAQDFFKQLVSPTEFPRGETSSNWILIMMSQLEISRGEPSLIWLPK